MQIKIDEARLRLPEVTRQAIDAVDWRGAIMQIRNREGYDFIQLGDLEMETELVLCGLANPEEYPRRIEKALRLTHEAAQKLVADMNERVFKKIKEEMIKIAENQKVASEETPPQPAASAEPVESREEILQKIESPLPAEAHPLLAEKLSGPMQMPSSKTIHSLDNLTKPGAVDKGKPAQKSAVPQKYNVDPYREAPE